MRRSGVWIAAAALGLAACQITPVIGEPQIQTGDRYNQCRRAAKDYCEEVKRAQDEELSRCVSEATYQCVAGSAGGLR
jgi:hypothetical protein